MALLQNITTYPYTLILPCNPATVYDEFKFPEFKMYLRIAKSLLGLF